MDSPSRASTVTVPGLFPGCPRSISGRAGWCCAMIQGCGLPVARGRSWTNPGFWRTRRKPSWWGLRSWTCSRRKPKFVLVAISLCRQWDVDRWLVRCDDHLRQRQSAYDFGDPSPVEQARRLVRPLFVVGARPHICSSVTPRFHGSYEICATDFRVRLFSLRLVFCAFGAAGLRLRHAAARGKRLAGLSPPVKATGAQSWQGRWCAGGGPVAVASANGILRP